MPGGGFGNSPMRTHSPSASAIPVTVRRSAFGYLADATAKVASLICSSAVSCVRSSLSSMSVPFVDVVGLSAHGAGPAHRALTVIRSVEADVRAHPVGVAVEQLLAQGDRSVGEAALQGAAVQDDVPALMLARPDIDQAAPLWVVVVAVPHQAP